VNTLPTIVVAVVLVALLARWKQVYPNRPLVKLALVPGVLSLGLIFFPDLFWPLVVIDLGVLLLVLLDLFSVPRQQDFSIERKCGHIASLGKPQEVSLIVTHRGRRNQILEIRDGAEEKLRPEPAELLLAIRAKSRSTVPYELRPSRRGRFELRSVFVRARSRWGLWQRMMEFPVLSVLNVYPDMRQLGEYALLARTNRLSLMGVRRTRKIGQDNEFERLRDYTLDDNYKHIDWRSTARRNKLTVKDFQANQSQRVIFLVDCGRMMTNEAAGISLLDHALNAMLMLSYVALRQGDQVGLTCFSDGIHNHIPPGGGLRMMNRLLHASYDRFPHMVESRYDKAFLHLAAHCRKRAMVVLITNVIDEVNAHQVQQYMTNLVGRHLPLGILLRDHQLFDAVEVPEVPLERLTDDQLYPAAAAADILNWRQQVLTDLETKGVLSLDVFPENMTAPLVNRYLEIKARHLL
jgi:uncharacterized protein (DUF58 family)